MLWGHLAIQSTAKGQAFMSLQSGGVWSQQDISSAVVTMGALNPAPADAADEPPTTTRLTTARIVSNRERATQSAIPNTFTSGPLRKAASDHMIDTAPGFKVRYGIMAKLLVPRDLTLVMLPDVLPRH